MSLIVVPGLETLLLLQLGQHVAVVVFGLKEKQQKPHFRRGVEGFEVVS